MVPYVCAHIGIASQAAMHQRPRYDQQQREHDAVRGRQPGLAVDQGAAVALVDGEQATGIRVPKPCSPAMPSVTRSC